MKLHQYIPLALRTESHLVGGNGSERIIHSVLGFITEHHEYKASKDPTNSMEELGDLFWYTAPASDELSMQWESIVPPIVVTDIGWTNDLARLTDFGKRWFFYRKEPSMKEVQVAQEALIGLTGWIIRETRSRGFNVEKVLDANVAKLQKRFPEKFTQNSAINRDLAAELQALETYGTAA